MKRIFLSFIAILLVLGCSKNLPTEGEVSRDSKNVTVVFSGETIDSPKFGNNIKSDWDMEDMTVTSETSAEVTVSVIPGRTYRINIEYSSGNWAADRSGTHGKVEVDGKELTNIEDNGQGGMNFLLSVE